MKLVLAAILVLVAVVQTAVAHKMIRRYASQHVHDKIELALKSYADERAHILEHMKEPLRGRNLDQVAEKELRLLYFKMHDDDNNDKLDGIELIKSLMHWHLEENDSHPAEHVRIFMDHELIDMVDQVLESDDKNDDGFVDFGEFIAANKARGYY